MTRFVFILFILLSCHGFAEGFKENVHHTVSRISPTPLYNEMTFLPEEPTSYTLTSIQVTDWDKNVVILEAYLGWNTMRYLLSFPTYEAAKDFKNLLVGSTTSYKIRYEPSSVTYGGTSMYEVRLDASLLQLQDNNEFVIAKPTKVIATSDPMMKCRSFLNGLRFWSRLAY